MGPIRVSVLCISVCFFLFYKHKSRERETERERERSIHLAGRCHERNGEGCRDLQRRGRRCGFLRLLAAAAPRSSAINKADTRDTSTRSTSRRAPSRHPL